MKKLLAHSALGLTLILTSLSGGTGCVISREELSDFLDDVAEDIDNFSDDLEDDDDLGDDLEDFFDDLFD